MKGKARHKRLAVWCLALAVALAAYFTLTRYFGIGCPIRHLTGVPCPTCGISRAWMAALYGRFAAAFRYHPLFPIAPLLILLPLGRNVFPLDRVPKSWMDGILIGMAGLFFVTWVARLVWGVIP